MAKHRERVLIGKDEAGNPLYTFVSGKSLDELHDNTVKAYVTSGRILSFLPQNVGNECTTENDAPKQKPVPFESCTRSWLSTFKKKSIEETTLKGYESYLRKHLNPEFRGANVWEIIANDIQIYLNERDELSKKTLREHLNLLKQILNSAVEDKIIEWNPAYSKRIKNPSDKIEERDALPLDIFQQIIFDVAWLDEKERRLVALLLFTGMRRGEVLGLRWDCVKIRLKFSQHCCHYAMRQIKSHYDLQASSFG